MTMDMDARTVETPSSAVAAVCSPSAHAAAAGTAGSEKKSQMDASWVAVFHLPRVPTCTSSRLPHCAIHSRSAETAISLDTAMIAHAVTSVEPLVEARSTRHEQTSSLSVTGSRKAPKRDVTPSLRASRPSKRSVSIATPNSDEHHTARCGSGESHRAHTIGMKATRESDSAFGTCLSHPTAGCPSVKPPISASGREGPQRRTAARGAGTTRV
mmetsp:Transcript_17827/g.55480  ORF Transcript_17827/g.55480 Transcript_17827/m.55480 type:complete len:213 (+) Transcript_17827:82-720(+)